MSNCKLIVNADDLGIDEAVNAGIFRAHEHGIVTSASVMANGSAFATAVDRLKQLASLDIGVHLTLVEESPLLDPEQIPTLVDGSGRFHNNAYAFFKQYIKGGIDVQQVRNELDAQVARVLNSGVRVSHLDSHQHIHVLPRILDVVIGLAEKYDIPAMRVPRERLRPGIFKPSRTKRIFELVAINALSSHADRRTPLYRGAFLGFFDGGQLNISRIRALLTSLAPGGVYELMCHPGERKMEDAYGHWGYRSEQELLALTDGETRKMINDLNIELTSYAELSQA